MPCNKVAVQTLIAMTVYLAEQGRKEKGNMRIIMLLSVAAAAVLFASPMAWAQEGRVKEANPLKAFERMDTNGDGVISKAEWMAAVEQRRSRLRTWLGQHPEILKRIDTDGDGTASDVELEKAWIKWRAQRQRILALYATDRDGTLSPEERAARRAKFRKAHPELFKKLDANGDGVLDPQERKAAREKLKARRGQMPRNPKATRDEQKE